MESTNPSSSPHKKPKLNSENNDRISNLPEPILNHILSFLPTKQAIQSSILSNTWKTLWKTRNSFDFDYTTYCKELPMEVAADHLMFIDTAKKVLDICQPLPLHYFRFSYVVCAMSPTSGMISLFSVLEDFRVQCLDLKQPADCLSFIPTLKYLTVLKLNLGMRQLHSVSICSSMWLPSLETVHFESVNFLDGSEFFEKFFSKCPLLSKLIIANCGIDSEEHVTITSASLQHLEIRSIYGFDINFRRTKDSCEITICTPNLVSFKCRSYIANRYFLEDLSSLKDAEIDMKASDISQLTMEQKKMFGTEMVELLGGLRNAESIMLSGLVITVIATEIEVFATPFHALKHLKMKTWLTRNTIKVIHCLLHHCDNIETLSLEVIALDVDVGIKRSVFFAEWKFSHLRVLKIKGIQGFGEEVDFLKGVLNSATNLEELIVFKRKDAPAGSEKQLEDMMDTLLALPREASSIKIRIC